MHDKAEITLQNKMWTWSRHYWRLWQSGSLMILSEQQSSLLVFTPLIGPCPLESDLVCETNRLWQRKPHLASELGHNRCYTFSLTFHLSGSGGSNSRVLRTLRRHVERTSWGKKLRLLANNKHHDSSYVSDPLGKHIIQLPSSLQMRPESQPVKTTTSQELLSQNHSMELLPNDWPTKTVRQSKCLLLLWVAEFWSQSLHSAWELKQCPTPCLLQGCLQCPGVMFFPIPSVAWCKYLIGSWVQRLFSLSQRWTASMVQFTLQSSLRAQAEATLHLKAVHLCCVSSSHLASLTPSQFKNTPLISNLYKNSHVRFCF